MEMMEEEGLYEIVYICKVVFVTVVSFLQEASCPVKALAPLRGLMFQIYISFIDCSFVSSTWWQDQLRRTGAALSTAVKNADLLAVCFIFEYLGVGPNLNWDVCFDSFS